MRLELVISRCKFETTRSVLNLHVASQKVENNGHDQATRHEF